MLGDCWKGGQHHGPFFIPAYVFNAVRVRRAERAERFDARFGTDTDRIVYPWRLQSLRARSTRGVHPYEATPAWLIRSILHSLPVELEDFEFVDFGSGKGRSLLVAAEFPFTKIAGIEISRELHEIARRNIQRYIAATRTDAKIDLHCMDATRYRFSREPVVLFLFNPFDETTLCEVVARLEESLREHPRDAVVIYVNPRFRRNIERSGALREIACGGDWFRPWAQYVVYRAYGQAVCSAGALPSALRGNSKVQSTPPAAN